MHFTFNEGVGGSSPPKRTRKKIKCSIHGKYSIIVIQDFAYQGEDEKITIIYDPIAQLNRATIF